jgi:hypothetical protein
MAAKRGHLAIMLLLLEYMYDKSCESDVLARRRNNRTKLLVSIEEEDLLISTRERRF